MKGTAPEIYLIMVNVFFMFKKFAHCCKDKFVMSQEKIALPQTSDYH